MKLKKIIKNILRKIIYKYDKNKRKLTLKKICKVLNIELPKEFDKIKNKKTSIVTGDFKSIIPNCIYFSYKDNMSETAIKKIKENSLCVFTRKEIEGCNCIIIENPQYEILKIYNYLRNLNNTTTICVTGSVGKTSTKEIIESVLKTKYKRKVISSKGNANSIRRTCENISKITRKHKVYLQEAGIGGSINKDMITRIALMTEPDIVVYTNIRDSHIEWYGTREKLAEEKCKLSEHGKKEGYAVINYDDPVLMKYPFKQNKITYSLKNKKADFYATEVKCTSSGTSFIMNNNINGDQLKINISLIGEHHVLNSLSAFAVGYLLNIDNNVIKKGIENYNTTGIRQNLFSVGNYQVLADCYNSSYDAINNIMKTFTLLKPKENGRKIAVIGDIFELGELSDKIHKDVGKLLTNFSIDQIYFCGNNVKLSYDEYTKKKKNAYYFDNKKDLENTLSKTIKENDIILFKASNGMKFYNLINRIFGTNLEEKLILSKKAYKECTTSDFRIYKLKEFCFLKEYIGKNKSIAIPEKFEELEIENILDSCFYEKNIKEVKLSDNIVKIGNHAFSKSTLENIEFNKKLKTIGESAFELCDYLKEIKLNEGLITIKKNAFKNCKNLKKITIPKSVQSIGENAFSGNKEIKIFCFKSSYAHKYAEENKLNYTIIKN